MGDVVRLNAVPVRELPVSKKQLAAELGRSTRWVNYRMQEGMPFDKGGPHGHPRFYPSQVKTWLQEQESTERPVPPVKQIEALVSQVDKLVTRIDKLERKVA